MKRLWVLLMIAVLCLSVLAGCGSKTTSNKHSSSKKETSVSTEKESDYDDENDADCELVKEDETSDEETSDGDSVSSYDEESTDEVASETDIPLGTFMLTWSVENNPDILEIIFTGTYNGKICVYSFSPDTQDGRFYMNYAFCDNEEVDFESEDPDKGACILWYDDFFVSGGSIALGFIPGFTPTYVTAYVMNPWISYDEGIRGLCNFNSLAVGPDYSYSVSDSGEGTFTQFPTGAWEYSSQIICGLPTQN